MKKKLTHPPTMIACRCFFFFLSFFLDQILFKIVHTSMMNRLLLFAIISKRLSTVLHIRNFFIEMLFTYVSIFMYIPFLYIHSFWFVRSLCLSRTTFANSVWFISKHTLTSIEIDWINMKRQRTNQIKYTYPRNERKGKKYVLLLVCTWRGFFLLWYWKCCCHSIAFYFHILSIRCAISLSARYAI